MKFRGVFCLAGLLAVPTTASAQSVRIDFGDDTVTTGGRGEVWNDLHSLNHVGSHALVDTTGIASGIQLDFEANKNFGRSYLGGVQTPAQGSPLEALGWPVTAITDGLRGGVTPNAPEVLFTLSGLDPTATYDFTFVTSLLGAPDRMASEYTATGANVASAELEPAQNDSELARVSGIVPDASGQIDLRVRTATTNTIRTREYSLGALGIDVHPAGTQSALVGFSSNRLHTSRIEAKGPFSGMLDLYTNNLTAPLVALTAVDDATQLPPTWLSVPASAVPGVPFQLDFDPNGLGLGDYSATIAAAAGGYAGASFEVTMRVRDPGPLNVLFYGNSWSGANGGYADLIEAMADQRGIEAPAAVHRFALGKQSTFHANNTGQIGAISLSLPLGEEWDFAVMLAGSLEPTANAGNPAQLAANLLQITDNVRAHSPSVLVCAIQPWARGAGHNLYLGQPPTFASPLEMHEQVRAGYEQAVAGVNAVHGPGAAQLASCGEAVMLLAFDPQYYGADLSHPGPAITLMTAMTAFTTIYGSRVCDLDVDFQMPSLLASELTVLGFDEDDWHFFGGLADRAAAPELRRHPGSAEDLLLTTGLAGNRTACSLKRLEPGERLRIRVESPNGSYDGSAVTLHFDLFPNGAAPGPYPPSPELHYEPLSSWVAATTPSLTPGGLRATLDVEPWMIGRTLLIQAVVQAPSPRTGNVITATDGHEIRTRRMQAAFAW